MFCYYCMQRSLTSPALGPCVVCSKHSCAAGTTQLQGAPHGAACACCEGSFLCYRHANEHAGGHESDVSRCFADLTLAATDGAARALSEAHGVARGSDGADALKDAFDRYLSVVRPAGHEEFRGLLGLDEVETSDPGAPLMRFTVATAMVPGIARSRLAALAHGATELPGMFGAERRLPRPEGVTQDTFAFRPYGKSARMYYSQLDARLGDLLGAVAPELEKAGIVHASARAIASVKLSRWSWDEVERLWHQGRPGTQPYETDT